METIYGSVRAQGIDAVQKCYNSAMLVPNEELQRRIEKEYSIFQTRLTGLRQKQNDILDTHREKRKAATLAALKKKIHAGKS